MTTETPDNPELTIMLMALLSEIAETDEVVLELEPEDAASMDAATLKTILAGLPFFEGHEDLLEKSALAVNLEVARPDTPIKPGDEIALLPPVSGG